MSGRPTQEDVEQGADEMGAVGERIGRHVARREPRQRALGYLRGLLRDAQGKNGWQRAEYLGNPTPDGVQQQQRRPSRSGLPSETIFSLT
jgi:hypothetical protein